LLVVCGDPAPAAASGLPDRWEELRRDDLMVAAVTYRLAVANAALCREKLSPQPGFVVHSIEQYGQRDRDGAVRSFGLGNHVAVMAVVADSPAALAGLRADDQIFLVNGRALSRPIPASAVPTNARLEEARQLLQAEMTKGAVVLRVSRPDGARDLRFAPEMGCPSNVELVPGAAVNAWANGQGVVVSAGLLERCATDADLALVIAHELAHNLLHHDQQLARAGIRRNGLLHDAGAGSAEMRATEEQADRLGVHLAAAAGYDLSGAAAFLGGLQMRAGAAQAASTHPAPGRRLAMLTAAIALEAAGPAPKAPSIM